MAVDTNPLDLRCRVDLLARNGLFTEFFTREAPRLARACEDMSRRFLAGGRLLAFGRGAAATDAQHVTVEFVHPVIVGKRALPALNLGPDAVRRLPGLLRSNDMVMAFGSLDDDAGVAPALRDARVRGALTFGLPGHDAEYAFDAPHTDPFVCQEVFEVLYHVLWETVHVYFEHREQGHDVGASSFLYPFLGRSEQPLEGIVREVENSMLDKVAETNAIRTATAATEAATVSSIARAINERIERGGKIITFGNGGSATDADDFAEDCVAPPHDYDPIEAISLAAEGAVLTAIANDVGAEEVFSRQLIAHGRPEDVAIAISTSGNSLNILSGLVEARKRGLLTIGISGYDGGKVVSQGLADHSLVARSDYIPRIQEVQASLYHVLRGRLQDLRRGDGREDSSAGMAEVPNA